jgi:hypothetical protein
MTTFTGSPAASADDAQETGGTNTINGTTINANYANQIAAVRFTGVTIPPGSTINNAYLTLNLPNATYDDPDLTIRGSGEANAAAFTTATDHLTNRLKTSASVAWSAANIGTGARNSPELKTLVQETINISGWASGNALAFYFTGSATSSFRFYTYDNGTGIPSLTIDYTPPGTTAAGRKLRTQRLNTKVGGVLTA